jgi:hypothetical protein
MKFTRAGCGSQTQGLITIKDMKLEFSATEAQRLKENLTNRKINYSL